SPIGGNRISNDFGSEHFADLSTKAATVAVNAVREASGPAKSVLGVLSWILRGVNFLNSPKAATSMVRAALHAVAVVAVLGVLAWAAGPLQAALGLVCTAVLVAFGVYALIRTQWVRALVALVVIVIAVVLAAIGPALYFPAAAVGIAGAIIA